ncbi:hypothetical protein [Thauera sinica]|uniref:Lipoprotein n=1 Tax=Thauera sinica TaxID=2665146 RepID=A0ABW1AUW0_9RHOO|nr:hypothetical protein [Thauera sp. K11]ATE59271.1 hypothetical protein CCZ27_04270 [Thauera sp. K11]
MRLELSGARRRAAAAMLALMLGSGMSGCASTSASRAVMDDPSRSIVVGVTTRDDVGRLIGEASERFVDDDGSQVWIFSDVLDVPLLVSFIPIVGDVTDAMQMVHTDREMIVQFDAQGVVRKVKVRKLD